ncbi:MAG: DUF2267 domain-containing protein [Paludibacterium sp.]|uniref:DUF2267 domain-containing protein n=1 Tax=Paludibacterium sp. TaxID=1917523 RepID=UPI0025FBA8F8|nr:DUF2267 domain-containing protein [Paludibacterium sp.]MBV8046205.1 DUF2267 domain-containing protein [Paludibacterium sp.]MBV8646915.1 DUF2267 domain-containing protein [Paludibacterium sp.]
MTLPFEYQNASKQFEQFMLDARDAAGLATTNMAWNMVVGVLRTFRSRLTVPQALLFADALPPVLRALFVEQWDTSQPIRDFGSPEALLDEVRSVRRQHNFSPDDAIQAVAIALRKNVDPEVLRRTLASLPTAAQNYWGG